MRNKIYYDDGVKRMADVCFCCRTGQFAKAGRFLSAAVAGRRQVRIRDPVRTVIWARGRGETRFDILSFNAI